MDKIISVNIDMDKDLYKQAELYFDKSGLNFTEGVNMLIKKALKHKTLKQRLEEFYGKDFETILKEHPYEYEEVDWGKPVGREIW